MYRLDVNPIPQALENIRIPARVVEVFDVLRIDAAAFAHRPVTPFALDPSGLVLVRGNGETLGDKLVGNNRSDENGATYSYGGRRSSNAVQVRALCQRRNNSPASIHESIRAQLYSNIIVYSF